MGEMQHIGQRRSTMQEPVDDVWLEAGYPWRRAGRQGGDGTGQAWAGGPGEVCVLVFGFHPNGGIVLHKSQNIGR